MIKDSFRPHTTRRPPTVCTAPTATESSFVDKVQDTFHRGYVSTMVAFPGAAKGGLLGAAIGFTNTAPLIPLFGMKPALITAGVLGAVGMVAGGALYHSLAGLD
jgi:hypothetical protein